MALRMSKFAVGSAALPVMGATSRSISQRIHDYSGLNRFSMSNEFMPPSLKEPLLLVRADASREVRVELQKQLDDLDQQLRALRKGQKAWRESAEYRDVEANIKHERSIIEAAKNSSVEISHIKLGSFDVVSREPGQEGHVVSRKRGLPNVFCASQTRSLPVITLRRHLGIEFDEDIIILKGGQELYGWNSIQIDPTDHTLDSQLTLGYFPRRATRAELQEQLNALDVQLLLLEEESLLGDSESPPGISSIKSEIQRNRSIIEKAYNAPQVENEISLIKLGPFQVRNTFNGGAGTIEVHKMIYAKGSSIPVSSLARVLNQGNAENLCVDLQQMKIAFLDGQEKKVLHGWSSIVPIGTNPIHLDFEYRSIEERKSRNDRTCRMGEAYQRKQQGMFRWFSCPCLLADHRHGGA